MQQEFTMHDGRAISVEQNQATGIVTIQCMLRDVNESGRTQPVIIHLTGYVEVVVPKPGVTPGVMDPDNELAVTRVELMDGDVRAMVWNQPAVADREPVIVTLVAANTTPLHVGGR